jgi:DNA-binding phage protein
MESTKFEVTDYLDSDEMIAAYLKEAFEHGNESELLCAIEYIIGGFNNLNH